MPHQKHIVIIGGTACGPKTAARARRCDPHAKITLIERRGNLSTATCGLPYFVSGVIQKRSEMVAREVDYFRNVFDMTVLTGTEATAIDRNARTVSVRNLATGEESAIAYDKLVLATGAKPTVFDWEGKDLAGIFTLSDIPDADAIREMLVKERSETAVIVGAGLIGLEMAEALAERGLDVTVIEARDRVFPALLDPEVSVQLKNHMESEDIRVYCNAPASGFLGDGNGHVRAVLAGGMELPADIVLLALGVKPEITLAQNAGLAIGQRGGISVDEHMRTSDPDIYAGGDCVEVRHRVTGEMTLAALGSTANKHGRIIGTNVTGGDLTFPGVLGTAIVKVFDFNAGHTGLNEEQARKAGYDVVTALVPSFEHATYYPGARELTLKLIADRSTRRILGGQGVGQGDIAKRIDVLVMAISRGATVDDLADLDLAYAPPFNSAMDPLHNAANVIRNKLAGMARGLSPAEVMDKLEHDNDVMLLDVRNQDEWDTVRLKTDKVKLIPLPELRDRLGELPRDKEIITFCQTSIRAFMAQRVLDGAGFENTCFLDGSIAGWPYDLETTED